MAAINVALTPVLHSVLFLASRVLALFAIVLPWKQCGDILKASVFLCIIQQIIHHYLRMSFVNERAILNRASKNHVEDANGILAKLIAAVEVYFWHVRRKPSILNLLHWLEHAFQQNTLVEITKWQYAIKLNLIYFWNSDMFALYIMQAKKDSSALIPSKKLEEWQRRFLERFPVFKLERYFPNYSYVFEVRSLAPSNTVWLSWAVMGRTIFSQLQDDPRERAYHMDSVAMHSKRLKTRSLNRYNEPVVFGIDQSFSFEKGISRRIHVEEVVDSAGIIQSLYNDADGLEKEEGEEIDHENVYCISYRHLQHDKDRHVQSLYMTFVIAAQLTKERGYTHFHVWMDQILRKANREQGRWAVDGLLPYAHY